MADGSDITLVTDLDGTLLLSDSMWECLLGMISSRPLLLFLVPFWLFGGRAKLKARLAPFGARDSARWPYNPDVVAELKAAKNAGRTLCLATAADAGVAGAVAGHFGFFDRVFASTPGCNLKGARKAERLVAAFGPGGFDYLGDSRDDLPVWAACRAAVLVGAPSGRLAGELRGGHAGFRVVPRAGPGLRALPSALRMHQWAKNALLWVALLLSHSLDGRSVFRVFLATVAFSLVASAVYVFNDLMDLDADHRHPGKKDRPFASGAIPLWRGTVLLGLSVLGGAFAAWPLPGGLILCLAAYAACNLLYTLRLKRLLIVDVVMLSGLYVLRVVAGAMAADVEMSNWLLGFSWFVFLGLSMVKRVAELRHALDEGLHAPKGRAYVVGDVGVMETMAAASCFGSIIILALYIDSAQALTGYTSPRLLFAFCPILVYWFGRVLLITHRGEMSHDPIRFALTDRASLLCAALGMAVFVLASVV